MMFSCVFLLAVCDPSPYGFYSQYEKIENSFQQPPLARPKPWKDGRSNRAYGKAGIRNPEPELEMETEPEPELKLRPG